MTTSAPQWPGQDGMHEPREVAQVTQMRDARLDGAPGTPPSTPDPVETPDPPFTPRPTAVPDPPFELTTRVIPDPPLVLRARDDLPSPVPVTRDIALALLEVEAGCRSALQLERVFSPQLWEALEHRIGRLGGPLPSGRSLISVRCQEDRPGLADTVAVVRKGELVRPVALRLDACGGRWTVTELRWWRNETDTAKTPGRDGGPS